VLSEWHPSGEPSARIHLDKLTGLFYSATKHVREPKTLGQDLRKLGLEVKQLRTEEGNRKGVEITKSQLDDLVERFGVV
jgi:hypothetical protein